jgi:plastocyanin
MTRGKYIVIIVILLALAGGAVALAKNKDKEPAASNTTAQDTKTNQAATDNTASGQSTGETATITYSDNGFSPSTITVKSGTTVTIKNTSSHGLQFDSDPHPAHTDDEELNVNSVPEGGSETFVVKRTGTFGYHNHLNPSDTGTIVVE